MTSYLPTQTAIAAQPMPGQRWLSRTTAARLSLLAPALLVLVACFLVPFVILVSYSLQEPATASAEGERTYGLANFVKLTTESLYQQTILTTLWIAVVVVVITLILGYALAFSIMRCSTRHRRLLLSLVILPLLLSGVIRTFGWMVLLAPNGLLALLLQSFGLTDGGIALLGRPAGIVIGLTHVLLPFMVLAIANNLAYLDPRLEEAASGLGASPIRTFLKVTLPLTAPGIATGTAFVFILAMGGFVTQAMLGYGRVQVLPLLVFDQATVGLNWPLASAAAVIMLIITLLFLTFLQRILSGRLGHARWSRRSGS